MILWLSISTLITLGHGPFEGILAKEKQMVIIMNKCEVNGCLHTHKNRPSIVKAGGICKQILVPNLPNSFRRQWRYIVHVKSNYNTEIQSRQVIWLESSLSKLAFKKKIFLMWDITSHSFAQGGPRGIRREEGRSRLFLECLLTPHLFLVHSLSSIYLHMWQG